MWQVHELRVFRFEPEWVNLIGVIRTKIVPIDRDMLTWIPAHPFLRSPTCHLKNRALYAIFYC